MDYSTDYTTKDDIEVTIEFHNEGDELYVDKVIDKETGAELEDYDYDEMWEASHEHALEVARDADEEAQLSAWESKQYWSTRY